MQTETFPNDQASFAGVLPLCDAGVRNRIEVGRTSTKIDIKRVVHLAPYKMSYGAKRKASKYGTHVIWRTNANFDF